MLAFILVLVLAVTVYAVATRWSSEHGFALFTLVCGIGELLLLLALRQTGAVRILANCFLLWAFLGLGAMNWLTAGRLPEGVWILPFLPILAALVLDARAATVWVVLVVLQLFSLSFASQLAPVDWLADAVSAEPIRTRVAATCAIGWSAVVVARERLLSRTRVQALRAEEQMRAIAELTPGAVLGIESGRVSYADHAMAALLGTEADLLHGRPVRELFFERDREVPADLDSIRSAMGTGRAEADLRPDEAPPIPVELSTVDLGSDRVILLVRDLREQQRQAERLQQLHKREALGQLAGGVAHDLNNQLAVIHMNAEALGRGLPEDPARRAALGALRQAADASADLGRQLLAYSRRQVIRPVLLDLDEELARLERLIRRVVPESAEVVVETGSDVPPVRVDREQLGQAVLNLVFNARDALGDRPGRIVLRTDRSRSGRAMLEVADNGAGIERDLIGRIFDPFFTTKEPLAGSGLGLSTVQGIVHQSGGEVRVQSRAGRGSLFRILLPAAAGDPAEESPPETSVSSGGCEAVLLVEDHEELRWAARAALQRYGYRVVCASNGAAALACAGPEIDLLVTDVMMPGMSGIDLADRLRFDRPELPVVFMTGYATELPSGAFVLQKPFVPATLAQRVREALDDGQRSRGTPASHGPAVEAPFRA